MVFDTLVMIGIIYHMYILHCLGLKDESENKIENISQAIERIVI